MVIKIRTRVWWSVVWNKVSFDDWVRFCWLFFNTHNRVCNNLNCILVDRDQNRNIRFVCERWCWWSGVDVKCHLFFLTCVWTTVLLNWCHSHLLLVIVTTVYVCGVLLYTAWSCFYIIILPVPCCYYYETPWWCRFTYACMNLVLFWFSWFVVCGFVVLWFCGLCFSHKAFIRSLLLVVVHVHYFLSIALLSLLNYTLHPSTDRVYECMWLLVWECVCGW